MKRHAALQIGCILCVLLAFADPVPRTPAADASAAQVEFFEKKVRPVLAEHCYKCHSTQAQKLRGGLLLDSRAAVLKGGDNGPALVPGQPEKSRLIEALHYKNVDLQMPPRAKLPETLIADLAAWVQMGAPWPKEAGPQSAAHKYAFDLEKRKQEHWSWQPIRPQTPPPVQDRSWPHGAIDQFILARLEKQGLTPAPAADRRTLVRRLYFDLIGLPPTPEEIEAFVNDSSAGAYEKLVDHLLASPHFGERWGRHWLDLVRYAESRGHESDYTAPNAYQYRDYVIRAFNADVPYNQLVTEQIAGDLLAEPRLHPAERFNESILGTGFWFLGEQVHSPVDTCQDKADRFDNMLDVMSKTFLGLTVACARCHDHKFDAISTKDYYSLSGFLESSSYRQARFDTTEQNRQVAAQLWQLRERSRPALQRALAEALKPGLDHVGDYLLAAREALRTGKAQRLAEIAQAHKLDVDVLGRWVAHLNGPAKEKNDPLHAWAQLMAPADDPLRKPAAILAPLVEEGRRRDADADAALKGAEIIVDYANPGPDDWLPDGVAFGPGPVRPGDLHISGAERPVVTLLDYAAAAKDATWDRLKAAEGAETEPGALGAVQKPGRTLRTPTFRVSSGKLFYLLKGSGRAFAAVDGHVMIAGPLHGKLVLPVKANSGFQWVAHDLSRYKGSFAHVEFTPAGSAAFAVAMVVQAADTPGELRRPNHALLKLLSGDAAHSSESLAAGYQALLADVAERLASDRLRGSPDAADHASLANWLLQRSELLGTTQEEVAEVVAPFLQEQARITARIQSVSRLAPAMQDATGVDEHVYIRGSYKAPGEAAPRRFLEALAGPAPLAVTHGSGRLELARQMTDPALNPFLPRVMVNRVWHHLFGRGIVTSVDNFGVLGEAPTHPELLDYLAERFVTEGWSVKRLIRTLVLSRTYQMSSQPDERGRQADPQNLLLHRMRVRRLEGEAIRDAMLAVSGRLDRQMLGPSVPVYLTAFQDGRGKPASGPLDGNGRRSVYLAVRRNFLPSLLLAFDTPIPFATVGRRNVSNVPAQALILLNDPFVHQQADAWGKRMLADGSARERLTAMYLSAFARPPSEAELSACIVFLEQQAQFNNGTPDNPAAWAALAHVLFNAKEFIFLQ